MKILYTASATAVGGRTGHIENGNGSLTLGLAVPTEMGGKGDTAAVNQATNPEELFAGGYAACFGSALEHIARQTHLVPGEVTVRASVGIGPNDSGGYGLAVTLDVMLPALNQAAAEELVAAAHHACPYSNAIRGNVEVILTTHGGV